MFNKYIEFNLKPDRYIERTQNGNKVRYEQKKSTFITFNIHYWVDPQKINNMLFKYTGVEWMNMGGMMDTICFKTYNEIYNIKIPKKEYRKVMGKNL